MNRDAIVGSAGLLLLLMGCGDKASSNTAQPDSGDPNGPDSQGSESGEGAGSDGAGSSPAGVDVQPTDPVQPGEGGASEGGAPPPGSAGANPAGPVLADCQVFPADNPWNTDVSSLSVHSNSDAYIDSIGRGTTLHADFGTVWQGAPLGIPFDVVDASQPSVAVQFQYADESDAGPYPIPANAQIEGGPDAQGDRHVLVLDADSCSLYELFNARPQNDGSWQASSGAVFDLASNLLRPDRYTSADAAGLPILPGLVRYDEVVEKGEILHALRFTVSNSQRGYINPATHAASSSTDADLPPMGLRLRMKVDYDCGGLSDEVQVICTALKRFGMFVADNGSNWFLSGAPDPAWSDDNLADLSEIPGDAFEVVDTGPVIPY